MPVHDRKISWEKVLHTWCTVAEEPSAYTRQARQLSLFDSAANGRSESGEALRDPAFSENKSLPVHRWVPWIAGYSAAFVDDVLSAYVPAGKPALVLDPFCGVGTTLLQATLRGHHAIGCEINPYAVLATRAKLSAPTVHLADFDTTLKAMRALADTWRTAPAPGGSAPPLFKSRLPFFSPAVENQVLHALDFINTITSEPIANLCRAAFGAVMVSFSNYSYEPSLGSRPAAGKPLIAEADVGRILLTKLHQMRADIAQVQAEMPGQHFGTGRVLNADFFNAHGELETGSVDVMVTSPPYMNNYHYVRNTRPQLYWLNFIASPGEQKHLETHNFGQYWQTVRDGQPVVLTFAHHELETTLEQLRATRTAQGAYGGPGWANYVATYFNDCFRFMAVLKRVLARRGLGVVVIGNSIIQGIDIRTERLLGEIAVMQGLLLEGVYCIRNKRVGASITQSSVRQGERSKATLSEFAVIVRQR
jgi:SAM-dependent methyltransferase